MRSPMPFRLLTGLVLLTTLSVSAHAQTLARISESKQINIGYRSDAPPFSSASTPGEPEGYTIDLCATVVEDIKLALQVEDLSVSYVPVDAQNRFDAITEGRIDLLCGATTITLERRERVSFSVPTFATGVSAVIRKDANTFLRNILSGERANLPPRALVNQALSERRFAAQNGTTAELWLQEAAPRMGVTNVVLVGSHNEGLDKLGAGEIDAYFADQAILIGLISASEQASDFVLTSRLFTHEPYGLALPRGDEDFRLLVDRSVSQQLRSGRTLELFAEHLGRPTPAIGVFYELSALPE